MSLGNERYTVQNPLIRYAVEAGWQYIPPDDAVLKRSGETGLIFRGTFISQVQKLNPSTVDNLHAAELIKRIESVHPTIEGNNEAWQYLKGLKTVYVDIEKRERNVNIIDSDNWERNIFHVTDEFRYSNGTNKIRADVVFLINGIPVLIVETKSAVKADGIAEALDQLRRYHREGPEMMALLQLFNITNLMRYYYGPTWNVSRKTLFDWKDESAGRDFEALVKTFVHPQRILRVLTDYLLFTRKNGELSKVVLRPHQIRATERVLQRALDKTKKRGLVWHTQGSGKTYTMITVARKMLKDPIFDNPTVLMIVDRNELEQQLFSNLTACGFTEKEINVARSKEHLRQLLAADTRGLIVTMIHKFDDIPPGINTRENIFVLIDEAHRSTERDLGTYLMAALPNATMIGFTGTPIDRTAHGKGTFKVFGRDDPKGYLDKYSIRESIEDGTTVKLHYTLAPNELRVDRKTLEEQFLNLTETEGISDVEELDRVLEKAVTLRNMLKSRERVDKVARYVAGHYKEYVEPMGYKAFLVGVDREACAFYKEALDRYLPSEYSAVVISRAHNDPPIIEQYYMSDQEEQQIRRDFTDPDKLPKILIVTEKLLTGYDAPVLYCMYLDKPMRDHVLLQAIARVNRPYEDKNGISKPSGFVLDFIGIFDNLQKALEFDSEDIVGTIDDIDVVKDLFVQMMEQAWSEYLSIISGESTDKNTEAALEHFRDREERQKFYNFFRELEDLYEILSPDAFLRPYLDDYVRLSALYRILHSAYEPGVIIDRELARKTAKLVQENTESGEIFEALDIYEINEHILDELYHSNKSDTVKVFNVLMAIEKDVKENARLHPYLIDIGERAERITKDFQERQINAKEFLKRAEELIRERIEAGKEEARKGMLPETFAVYWLLRRNGINEAEAIAKETTEIIDAYPFWQTSTRQNRDMLRKLSIMFVKHGITEPKPLVDAICRLLEDK